MGRKELMAFRADCGVHLDENGRIVMWENQAMSDVIKPEDVTQDILELAMERFQNAYWKDVTKQNVADFLDDCIDAGLVSPPVWVMKFNGEIQRDANGEPTVWPSRGLDSPDGSIKYEHWKGQRK